MHYQAYVKEVEACIDSVVGSVSRASWQEDHISYSICDALQARLKNAEIEGLSSFARVQWDAFKQRGQAEHKRGDIAVLVRYVVHERGEPLAGAGFLEAKAAYLESAKYDALDWPQLERICKETQYSMLLLYNHRKIRGYGDNVAFQQFSADEEKVRYAALSSHACVLQTLTALQVHIADERLHGHALPLSHQLCNRYLRFMDLDTSPTTVKDAEGWIEKGGRGGARYLLVATVVLNPKGQVPGFNINTERYERIGSDKPAAPDKGSGGGGPGAPGPKPGDAPDAHYAEELVRA